MVNSVNVPANYHYVLERFGFEYVRAVSSLTFMLDRNLNDSTWLGSQTYNDLLEEATNALVTRESYVCGVLGALIDPSQKITKYKVNRTNDKIAYRGTNS